MTQPTRSKTYEDYLLENAKTYVYGSETWDQYLLHNPESLPRFGHLARKALMHYAGDRYNPQEDGWIHEPFLRSLFKELMMIKILHRAKTYDWDWIDNALRKYISRTFDLALPYDESRVKKGYKVNGINTVELNSHPC